MELKVMKISNKYNDFGFVYCLGNVFGKSSSLSEVVCKLRNKLVM